MPSTVLTWCVPKSLGAPTVSNDTLAAWNTIVAGLQVADDDADFPWVTCDVNTTSTAAHYIVMKPKSGAAGRIVMGNNKDSVKFNPSIQFAGATANPSSDTFFAFYIAGATSDTLTNLKGSGPLFTGENLANSTPIVYNQYLAGITTESIRAFANEEAILIALRPNSLIDMQYTILVGGILVNDTDEPYNGVMCSGQNNPVGVPTSAITQQISAVVWHRRTPTGEPEAWGKATTVSNELYSKARDQTNKKAYFFPYTLGSLHAITPDRMFYFTFRQLGLGPAAIAPAEQLRDGASNLKAICPFGGSSTAQFTIWLCNFKLNV